VKEGAITRVLLVSGPPLIVNEPFLARYLESSINFDVDEIIEYGGDWGRVVVEFRFVSCSQSLAAIGVLNSEELKDVGVQICYGKDPCDVIGGE
jgi:hypothetical protein